jgi:hypothetical protein
VTRPALLAEAAIALGLPVFACACDKRPLTTRGLYDATADPSAIRRMFAQPRAALIAMPTGRASGLVVVDVDVKKGAPGMAWLRENAHALPETRTHRTPSDGQHLLFVVPDDVEIRNSASRITPGVDVRGEGGYIVMPPSRGYSVIDYTEPAAMPRWLVKACLPLPPPPPPRPEVCDASPDRTARRLTGLVGFVATAPEGRRNANLFWAACRAAEAARAGEISIDAAKIALEAAATAAGLPQLETQRTIASAIRRTET